MRIQPMTIYRRGLSVALLLLLQGLGLSLTSQQPTSPDQQVATDKTAVQAQYASLPLAFEPNQGQVDGSAQFLVHHGQATTYFDGAHTTTSVGADHITMSLDGTNAPTFSGTDRLESKTNYFIGNDPSRWHADVPNYKELVAKNVYPGIDLKYYGTNSQLEHDFIINPGSDYKQIAFHFDGQKNVELDKDGNLVAKTGESDIRLNAPTTYQITPNSKHTIPSHFELHDKTVTIALNEDYDHTQPLIIDPVLIYSTYVGGSGADFGVDIAVDPSSNAYITGYTNSSNFPTSSPYQASNAGGVEDAFITKLNAAGTALVYSTYLGGSGDEYALNIAVDTSGNAHIIGQTNSSNFPTSSPYQASYAGGEDVFVTKLNAAGSALTYSTYLGGSGQDTGYGIALDSSGNAYLAGLTTSTNFPTSSPYQASKSGGQDAFITKLNAAGSALTYSTYLGGSGNDHAQAIATDTAGNAYLTGNTLSSNFPTSSPYQGSNAGSEDTFATKLNAAGSALTYSTYLGGSGDDFGHDIAVDASNNAYIAGYTTSTNFPTSSPIQASNGGGQDAYVTKLNATGSALTYSTYLGGSASDGGYGITIDTSNNAFVSGQTYSINFPTSSPLQASNGGLSDGFVSKLNSAGSALTYSTYLGGSTDDYGDYIALDPIGIAYVVGVTTSGNFPTRSPYQASYGGGGQDAFIAKLTENTVTVTGLIQPSLTFSIGSTTCSMGFFSATQTQDCTHTMSAGSNATGGYVISYIPTTTLTSGANTITAMSSQAASVVGTEQFGMNLKANTSAGSFTSANFGANPSGGTGTVMSGYQTGDLFKFATGGANIAQTTGASTPTTYTVSFITNITIASEAGTYSTPVTYNIVANY